MKRSELLSSKAYWLADIQLNLFSRIEAYLKRKKINKTQLAEELGVTKGYVSQILNGDFDHKISKMIDLSLACDSIPLLFFVDKQEFIKADAENKAYEIMPMYRGQPVSYSAMTDIKSTDFTKLTSGIVDNLPKIVSGGQVEIKTEASDISIYEINQAFCQFK